MCRSIGYHFSLCWSLSARCLFGPEAIKGLCRLAKSDLNVWQQRSQFFLHKTRPVYGVRESKTAVDPWFHAVEFRIPGTGSWIPVLVTWTWILDSNNYWESGFHRQYFPGFRNPDPLTWGEKTVLFRQLLKKNTEFCMVSKRNQGLEIRSRILIRIAIWTIFVLKTLRF